MPRLRRLKPARVPLAQMSGVAARQMRNRAKRARFQILLVAPLAAGVILAYKYRVELFGVDVPVRVAAAIALVGLGWPLARNLGAAVGPSLFQRVDPGSAGTFGFLIRFFVLVLSVIVALRIAGLEPRTLAVGGAFTAVIVGLAAQSTFGNLLAGLLLLSARPFRVGERIRLQAGNLAGQVEGRVESLGLLYVTLSSGDDPILVPNNVVLASAIVPLREPAQVDLCPRLRPEVKPSELQALLEESVSTPTPSAPHISLEEVDEEEVVMRIFATPESDDDGPRLADEILAAVGSVTASPQASGNGRRAA